MSYKPVSNQSGHALRKFAVVFGIFVLLYVAFALFFTLVLSLSTADIVATYLIPGLISAVIFCLIYGAFTLYYSRRS